MTSYRETLDINGKKLEITVSGKGYPILLLHGWGKDRSYFDNLINRFDQNNYKIIRFDWPGFGTTSLENKAWNLDDYSQYLKILIKKLKIDDFAIIAHSFGGSVIIKAVSQGLICPQKLVLCGSSGIRKPKSIKNILFGLLAKTGRVIFLLPLLNRFEDKAKKILYKASGSNDYLNAKDEHLKETIKLSVAEDLTPVFSLVKVPTLLLWGDKDIFTPLNHAKIMNSNMPDSILKVIPGADHALLRKESKKCADIINDFLQK